MAQSQKEFKSSDLQTAFSSSPVFTPKLVWVQLNSRTKEEQGWGRWTDPGSLSRGWNPTVWCHHTSTEMEPETPPWQDCQSSLGPTSLGHWSFLPLPLLFTVSYLAFSPLVAFLHLSRIKTISVDQVKDYLGVSLKQHLGPSQEIYILRGCFRKLKILGAKGVGL